MILVHANEATAAQRRVYFDLRDAADFTTPETGEAGGQPQISTNGGAFTNTGIGTLTHMGNGRYYADLSQTAVATAGDVIVTRYKSSNTAETPGSSVQVIGTDPAADNTVSTALTSYDPPTYTELLNLVRLLARKDAAIATDLSTELTAINADLSSGGGTYDNAADSIEAIRDRGDAAWLSGSGSISDILNVSVNIPAQVDLAGTATIRLAMHLTNALDDLPSAAEITPGTITIDRKPYGGTSWTNVRNAVACSEAAGIIYYDETFSGGNGYSAGDTIRIKFLSQKITVSANDYEITDGTTGWTYYTTLTTASSTLTAGAIADAVWDEPRADHTTAGTFGQGVASVQGNVTGSTASVTALPGAMRTGTAQTGAASTITLDSRASSTNDYYNDATVQITGGTGAGQVRRITDYVGSTKVATVEPNWATNPDNTSTFAINPETQASLLASAITAIWAKLTSAITTVGSIGKLIVDRLTFITSTTSLQLTSLVSDGTVIEATQGKAVTGITLYVPVATIDLTGYNALIGGRRLVTDYNTGEASSFSVSATIEDAGVEGDQRIVANIGKATTATLSVDADTITPAIKPTGRAYEWAISVNNASIGTAQAGASGTITLAADAPAVDDFFNGQTITTTGGTGSGQSKVITDYNGTTKVATVASSWSVTPDNTTDYSIAASDTGCRDLARGELSVSAGINGCGT